MPPERNNTVRFSQLSALTQASLTDIIPIVDTSIPTLVNKKISITGLNQSLPLYGDMTNVKSTSSNWNSVYSSFNANSAEYETTFSNIIANSANWDSSYTTVRDNSSTWTGVTTYSTVKSLSDSWNTAYALASSAYTSLSALSSNTWVLKAGDQLTGGLTTTKTNTATFALDELVTKRYVDATALATQISGNFIPGLYYTKNDFQTGVPLISSVISQFNQATVGVAGSLWSGNISLAPNQFGTDVPAFVFTTANPSAGNRAGIYIDGGSAGQFSFSQGGIGHNWNGPNFATVYNLTRAGTSRLSIYDDVNLNNNLNILGNAGANNLVFSQWRTTTFSNPARFNSLGIFNNATLALSSDWNNASTVFTPLSVNVNYSAADSNSSFMDCLINGYSVYRLGRSSLRISFNSTVGAFTLEDGSTGSMAMRWNGGYYLFLRGDSQKRLGLETSVPLCWGFASVEDTSMIRDEAGVIALRRLNYVGTDKNAFRIYNTYTDANNYERLSLSATRIAYEYAGTGVSRDLTIQSTGNLILSAGASIQLSQAFPFQISPLSSTDLTAPNGLTVVTGGGTRGVFAIDQYSHGFYSESGGSSFGSGGGQKCAIIYGGMSYYKNNPNRTLFGVNDDGKIFMGRLLGNYFTTNYTTSPKVSAHVSIITDSSYNSHVTDMLLLSAGPNVNIFNYINCVSAGQTIFSVNSAGQFNTANIAANKFSINSLGGFQTTNFLACESPDGYVIGTNNSGGSYSFVSVNNYAANAGPSNPALNTARGQWNFPSVINAPTAFTLNNQMYLLNYTATTDLIAVSSTRSTNGFYFYPTSTSFPAAASIYLDSQSFLNLNFQGGGGKSCVIGDGTNISLEARYPGNVSTMNGHWQFNAFNTATNNVTINQTAGQYGTLLRVLSTNSTAMFSVSADGVSRFNNKVFIKPTGLIQFTNETATTPAIKGTSTTVQARTGDDSQYTYLQGKLQTDQAASAGTFTPDKYIILYDSTGTAYKVPVQAL